MDPPAGVSIWLRCSYCAPAKSEIWEASRTAMSAPSQCPTRPTSFSADADSVTTAAPGTEMLSRNEYLLSTAATARPAPNCKLHHWQGAHSTYGPIRKL